MPSSELGTFVHDALDANITASTIEQTNDQFRLLGRRNLTVVAVLDNIKAATGRAFISRKRARHDALRLIREGETFP